MVTVTDLLVILKTIREKIVIENKRRFVRNWYEMKAVRSKAVTVK